MTRSTMSRPSGESGSTASRDATMALTASVAIPVLIALGAIAGTVASRWYLLAAALVIIFLIEATTRFAEAGELSGRRSGPHQVRASRAYLTRYANEAGIRPGVALGIVWSLWLVPLAGLAFLFVYTVFDFARHLLR